MVDLDDNSPTEIDLEMDQCARLLELFRCLETYDGRETVITFCEMQVKSQQEE